MKLLLLITLTVFNFLNTSSSENIFEKAAQESKLVFIYFSGSDWCHNCIRLNETVIKTERFKSQILDKCIFYEADFPQRTEIAKEVLIFNESLCEKYNPKGIFPMLVLINQDQEVLTSSTYRGTNLESYIDLFKAHLNE